MLDMPALAATRFPVTNEDYWHFLQVTKHVDRNTDIFLFTGDGVAAS